MCGQVEHTKHAKIHSTFKRHITKILKVQTPKHEPFQTHSLKLRPLKLPHSQAVRSPPFVARRSYSLFSGSGFSFSFFFFMLVFDLCDGLL